MRKALITMLLVSLGAAGCGDGPGLETYVQARFDAAIWSGPAGDAQLAYSVDDPEGNGYYIALASRTVGTTAQLFSLGLPAALEPGTYPLDGMTAYAAYASCPEGDLMDCAYWRAVPAHPGTLTITDVDAESALVSGTFAFNGYFLGDPDLGAKGFTGGTFVIRVPGLLPASPRASAR